jgi:ribosomal protein S18 acetylase RimI-like enzyme
MRVTISFAHNRTITAEQFIDVLNRSTLGERRPVHDLECMQAMVQNASLTCTAWDGDKLVGVARSVTDFAFCCYLSDLAVDKAYQHQGIGRELIHLTQKQLGAHCKINLLAAPEAEDYYPKIGMTHHQSAWLLARNRRVK